MVARWIVAGAALALAMPAAAQRTEDAYGGMQDLRLSVNGGLLTYTGEGARYTTPGAGFGVTVGSSVSRWMGGELAYNGGAYGTEEGEVEGSPRIVEHGLQGALRFGPQRAGGAEPYFMTGFGIQSFNVVGEDGDGLPVSDATLLRVPFGVGIDYRLRGSLGGGADLLLGTRAMYDVVVSGDPFDGAEGNVNANRLVTTLQVGTQF